MRRSRPLAAQADVDSWSFVLEHLVATNSKLRAQLKHAAKLHPDARVEPLLWPGSRADPNGRRSPQRHHPATSIDNDDDLDHNFDDDTYSQLDDLDSQNGTDRRPEGHCAGRA